MPPDSRIGGTLISLDDAEQREVRRRWYRIESGMDGERGGLPERPDDPIAYRLLGIAGEAMSQGEWQEGVNILRSVDKDYRHSQEAACARHVIDRLAERTNHGR